MRKAALVLLAPLSMLWACGQPKSAAPVANDVSADGDYRARIEALPDGQRDAVLSRAIDDAGFDCDTVTGSAEHAAVQGLPAWIAHCDDRHDWILVLHADGVLQVVTPEQIGEKSAVQASGRPKAPTP